MFRLLFLCSLMILIHSKTIFPWNITANSKKTSTFSTQTTTPTETTTVLDVPTTTILSPLMTTTVEYEGEITTTATVSNRSYEFQSNFSRNNDSVFVSLHSNASDLHVSINNTFTKSTYDPYPCEIIFNEHSNKFTKTQILINFNGTLTRDLATQLGDRLIDMADLLSTVRSMSNQNKTVETV